MSHDDRERWDARYASAQAHVATPAATVRWIPPATGRDAVALDLACGTGRHARALIDAGYRVVAADVSRVALTALRASLARGAPTALVQMDAEAWPFAEASFDVVVQIDFLDREALTEIRRAVKPGGLLLIDTFAGAPRPGGAGPQRAAWRLTHGELAERFADWEVLHVDDAPAHERAAILVRRPLAAEALR